jgi:hypothetical protein
MWTILSGDFDEKLRAADCTSIVTRKSKAGSIVVFHDSEKAWNRLKESLPDTLEHFANQGFRFDRIL